MNIQSRKLVLIEEFLRISDENLIAKIETFIRQEKRISRDINLKPMFLSDFHEMIDQPKQECNDGKIIAHQELKKKVATWK